MNSTLLSIVKSCKSSGGILNSTDDLLNWVKQRNLQSDVSIEKIKLSECAPWVLDDQGIIRNSTSDFFQICGIKKKIDNAVISQPIILQKEIGYLGILCKEFNGIMHFLMQAKIEPGNINRIQISPTIQATKSNFMQRHGGKRPAYLEFFLHAKNYEIIVDQIQSEQSSRFLGKRNRNIILAVKDEIEVLPSHRWMTLGQIKQLMRIDNLVNMDTRTVLSCIPFFKLALLDTERSLLEKYFENKPFLRSILDNVQYDQITHIYNYVNDYKMLHDGRYQLCSLKELKNWDIRDDSIGCKTAYPFKVVFCNIEIEGREVCKWGQPLFEAIGNAVFGLIMCEDQGVLKFLVHLTPEIGCFDGIELGPSVQMESVPSPLSHRDTIVDFFELRLKQQKGILYDHMLSEEGGRFYHEENRNILLMVDKESLPELPDGYYLMNYRTLNMLTQSNNVLNIQLRNLLSLLEV